MAQHLSACIAPAEDQNSASSPYPRRLTNGCVSSYRSDAPSWPPWAHALVHRPKCVHVI